ncbi:trypsin iota-like [Coccinella septempunctata]|uniref:trypsin iota-like n=1 Tax=Coccinella septempunctata TaxID=41139 RepID=UPI001D087750|nr:trypsin iota-like [Coccinella septempunctata]
MLSSIVFLVTFELIIGVLQAGKVQQRIRYGSDAEDFSVLLLKKEIQVGFFTMEGTCTATLITPQIILTAAHCFDEGATRNYVTYGCSDLKSKSCKNMDVVAQTIHPKYVNTGKIRYDMTKMYYDIAVAKLASPLPGITPKNLPGPDQTPCGYATLMGWGKTQSGKATEVLQSTTLQIVDRPSFAIAEEAILVDENNGPSGIEGGDSGGPLLIGDTVFGVASSSGGRVWFGNRYASYMSVQYYSDFIQNAMRKYGGR